MSLSLSLSLYIYKYVAKVGGSEHNPEIVSLCVVSGLVGGCALALFVLNNFTCPTFRHEGKQGPLWALPSRGASKLEPKCLERCSLDLVRIRKLTARGQR